MSAASRLNGRAVVDIDNGDWVALSQVDFGQSGAAAFVAAVSNAVAEAAIELRLDQPDGKLIGTLAIPAATGENWIERKTEEITGAEGIHDLFLVFRGESQEKLFKLNYWRFEQ
jgi:arabinoxylan arabinofuranohydrolase